MAKVSGAASSPAGKWHRTVRDEPTWEQHEWTACGTCFRPVNVSSPGGPVPTYASPSALCRKCFTPEERQEHADRRGHGERVA